MFSTFLKTVFNLISKRAVFNILVSIMLAILGYVTNDKLNDIIQLQNENRTILETLVTNKTKIELLEKDNILFKNHLINHNTIK